jgi:hypothetical protein
MAFGSFSRILVVLCTQQRCWSVSGQSLLTAFQNPNSPSPIANLGALLIPCCPIIDSHLEPDFNGMTTILTEEEGNDISIGHDGVFPYVGD